MFKLLRKYNKWILAVGGTLLMITFLIPFAFRDLGTMAAQGNATWATVGPDEDKVTRRDLGHLNDELTIAQSWMGYVYQQASYRGTQLPPEAYEAFSDLAQLNVKKAAHWYLLVREAEQAGTIGGPTEASRLLGQDGEELIRQLASGSQLQTDRGNTLFVRNALAKIRGVSRLLGLYRLAAQYSDARLIDRMTQLYEGVEADVIAIASSSDLHGQPPTQEELSAQLAAYADKFPGEGDKGFGYKLPNRVKLEWLTISADSVRRMLEHSEGMSQVALRKHWNQHYKTNPLFGTPSGTAPVPETVRKDLLDELTKEALEYLVGAANNELSLNRRGLPPEHGYVAIPDGWKGLSFADLAQRLQRAVLENPKYRSQLPLPEYASAGQRWLSAKDLDELPGIGTATTDKFGRVPLRLSELAMNAKSFKNEPERPLQVGIAGPPMRDDDDGIYIFRLIDADASWPPASVDEVRDALVADLNRVHNYDALKASIPALHAKALADGMLATALANDASLQHLYNITLRDQMEAYMARQRGQAALPRPTSLPGIGSDEPTVREIVRTAMSFPLKTPVADIPLEQRTLVLPVDNRLSVVVVQIANRRPVTREVLASLVQQGSEMLLMNDEITEPEKLMDAFKPDALIARHQFKIKTGQSTDESAPASAEGDAPAKAAMAP